MPQHLSITLNNTINLFNMSISQHYSALLCNKFAVVFERPGYPSNRPHTGMTFPLQAHWMATQVTKVVPNR